MITGQNTAIVALVRCLVFLVAGVVSAAPETLGDSNKLALIRFHHLGENIGLTSSAVNCILQDRRGFMWIGTENGLNRFDGQRIEVYRHIPFDPNSLSDNWVQALCEDSLGMLWIGTRDGGLNRLDPVTGTLTRFLHDDQEPRSLSHNRIWALVEDSHANLWIGTSHGLNRLALSATLEAPAFDQFFFERDRENGLSHDNVNALLVDREGRLWVGTFGGGLCRMEDESGVFTTFRHDSKRPDSLSNNRVKALFQDSVGDLWLGTWGGGLNRFDPNTGKAEHFNFDEKDPTSLSQDWVLAINEDSWGNLWVGTHAVGLNLMDRETRTFRRFGFDPLDPWSLAGDWVSAIHIDRSGLIWIGGGGISTVADLRKPFTHYRHEPLRANSLSRDSVNCVWVDKAGIVWIGTWGGGLNRLDRRTMAFTHYRENEKDPGSLLSDIVWALMEDSQNEFWVGTNRGLNRLDRASGRFEAFHKQNSNVSGNNISAIFEDRQSRLWVGTWGDGLNLGLRDNSRNPVFLTLRHHPRDPGSLANDTVTVVTEDRAGRLWVGTAGGGLDMLDESHQDRAFTFKHYRNDPLDRTSLSNNHITALAEDHLGNFWIGTNGGGLNLFLAQTGGFLHYMTEQGMPDNNVTGILVDNQGFLWIATQSGLARFDPDTGRFRNFDAHDGLQANEFRGSGHKTPAGELFFGGIRGLNGFFPDRIKDNLIPPPVEITKLSKISRDGHSERGLTGIDSVALAYRDYAVTFEFAALDFTTPAKNRYAYRLEGFNEDWISLGTRAHATFTNLAPGEYTLHVRAANNDGFWNEEGARLRLRVTPPPWRTWWAYTGYGLLGAGILFWLWRLQSLKLKRERVYAERLEKANTTLQVANERLKLADKIKDEFLANTSHELRTPLNGIIGLAQSVTDGVAGPINAHQKHELETIISSGIRLSNLVNDILDFSKLKRNHLVLKQHAVDVFTLVDVVLTISRPLLAKKPVRLVNAVEPDCPAVQADENRLEQILHNLVGNAVKFTEEGEIRVSARVRGAFLEVAVEDTGIGIPTSNLARIFESFEQVDGSTERARGGTGLGLAITNKLVHLHGGTIEVRSKLGEGSCFRFTLPLAQEGELPVKALPASNAVPGTLSEQPRTLARHSARAPGNEQTETEFRLLIVDDEPVNLQVLSNFLSLENYGVTQASSGAEALALIESGATFDLMILDIMMPKMSGYDVCRRIREKYPPHELPIVMLTAKTQESDLVTSFELGANDFLFKPISKSTLLARIHTHLMLLKTSRSLNKSNRKLARYSQTLERRVTRRTQELKERNGELETLDSIVKTINREVDLRSLLFTMLEQAALLFPGAERGLFFLRDSRSESYRIEAAFGFDTLELTSAHDPLTIAQWLNVPAKALQGEITVAVNLLPVKGPSEEPAHRFSDPPAASMIMPVVAFEGNVRGLMVLANQENPRAFQDSDLAKLERLEAHCVSAVVKAHILEEVRRKNEAVIKAQKQLITQEKLAYLGVLTAGIAHELKNPLNFVQNFSEVAVELIHELDEVLAGQAKSFEAPVYKECEALLRELEQSAVRVLEHGQRANRIVEGMAQHADSGSRQRTPTDLNKLLASQFTYTYQGMRAQGFDCEIGVEFRFDETLGETRVYAASLGRVLMNLIKNACYTLAEKRRRLGSAFAPCIELSTRNLGERVELGVQDNGEGIPANLLEKIFTPFFTTKPAGAGVGLGLSIAYDIVVQEHHGTLEVHAEETQYTNFTITLPQT